VKVSVLIAVSCVSASGEAVLGVTAEQISHGRQWMALVHPDDRPRLRGLREKFARGELTVAGVINASGAGGAGAAVSVDGGGGGGGAGGMIVLDAPQIALTGQVFANGAGGGEGADSVAGEPGQDPLDATTQPRGGLNNTTSAGEGGAGTTGA
jgi:hypothetical protein